LAHIFFIELLLVLHVLSVELCYTRAKQQWDYVTDVIQQDNAPAHFTLTVCEFLNESLKGQCIGWGCATSPSPLPKWPCSPNLSTPDDSLCTNSAL